MPIKKALHRRLPQLRNRLKLRPGSKDFDLPSPSRWPKATCQARIAGGTHPIEVRACAGDVNANVMRVAESNRCVA